MAKHLLTELDDHLPEWLPPLLVKELRQSLKSRWFVFSFIYASASMALLLFLHVNAQAEQRAGWQMLYYLNLGAIIYGLPLLKAVTSKDEDSDIGNLQFLHMSGLSAESITKYKILILMLQSVLSLMVILPFVGFRYFGLGTDLIEEFIVLALLTITLPAMASMVLAINGLSLGGRVIMLIFVLFMVFPISAASIYGTIGAFMKGDVMDCITASVLWIFAISITYAIATAFASSPYWIATHFSRSN